VCEREREVKASSCLVSRPSKIGGGEGLGNFGGKHYTLVLLHVTITYDDE